MRSATASLWAPSRPLVGYKSSSRFSEAFPKSYGVLPSYYRKISHLDSGLGHKRTQGSFFSMAYTRQPSVCTWSFQSLA